MSLLGKDCPALGVFLLGLCERVLYFSVILEVPSRDGIKNSSSILVCSLKTTYQLAILYGAGKRHASTGTGKSIICRFISRLSV
jgi:hypothetical protein